MSNTTSNHNRNIKPDKHIQSYSAHFPSSFFFLPAAHYNQKAEPLQHFPCLSCISPAHRLHFKNATAVWCVRALAFTWMPQTEETDAAPLIDPEAHNTGSIGWSGGRRSVSGENRADLFMLAALIVCGSEFRLIRGFQMQCLRRQWCLLPKICL